MQHASFMLSTHSYLFLFLNCVFSIALIFKFYWYCVKHFSYCARFFKTELIVFFTVFLVLFHSVLICSYYFCRYTCHNTVIRYIVSYYCTGGNNYIISYCNTEIYNCVCSDIYIVFYFNFSVPANIVFCIFLIVIDNMSD